MVCAYERATTVRTATMASVIGRTQIVAVAPSGSRTVRAASGPYEADASASSPSTGIAVSTPMRSTASSSERSGRPRSSSSRRILETYSRRLEPD